MAPGESVSTLAPSLHAQVDQDLQLADVGRLAALDGAPQPGEILFQPLDTPRRVTLPHAFCLEGPLPAASRALLAGGHDVEIPAPLAARCGGLRVLGQGILLWGERARLHCSSHFRSSPRRAGHFLPEFKNHLGPFFDYDADDHPRVELARLEEVRLPGPTLVLAQPGCRVFGHWLIEVLPRLRLAQRLGLPAQRFLLPSPFPEALLPLLAAYGVEPARVAWIESGRQIARLDDAVLTARLHFDAAFSPLAAEVMTDLRRHLVPAPPRYPRRRLFLSRRNWFLQNRRLQNRAEVTAKLLALGFEEITPETLPIAIQAQRLAEASHVVAEDGSLCHLMLYAEPGARLLILQPSNRSNEVHGGLAQVLGQQLGIVAGATSEPAPRNAPADYCIAPRDLVRGLDALLAN